jgi:putative (di)nucleoside polyphosphate hydrolase
MTNERKYRKNAAAFVINQSGQILACRRADKYHSWQIPQGGVDAGESLEEGMLRELEEEIGTRDVEVIGALPQPIRYDWPPHVQKHGYHGQEQHYFLVRLRAETKINIQAHLPAEFDQTDWVGAQEFLNRLDGFKAAAYTEALQQLKTKYPDTFAD